MFTYFAYDTFWAVFPIGVLIATTAMCSGIDGAVFWSPVFMFLFGLKPEVAIACGIFIEVFGFGSGVYGYALKKKILYKEVAIFLVIAIIFGLLGSIVSKVLPKYVIFGFLSISSIFLFYVNLNKIKPRKKNQKVVYSLEMKNKMLGNILNAIGGFMTGLIGVGLGESNHYYFLNKNNFPIPYSSGNAVFLIAITAFICSIFNVFYFSEHLPAEEMRSIYSIIIFAIPAVIIGGRLGVLLVHIINPKYFYYFVAFLFTFISAYSFYRMWLEL